MNKVIHFSKNSIPFKNHKGDNIIQIATLSQVYEIMRERFCREKISTTHIRFLTFMAIHKILPHQNKRITLSELRAHFPEIDWRRDTQRFKNQGILHLLEILNNIGWEYEEWEEFLQQEFSHLRIKK